MPSNDPLILFYTSSFGRPVDLAKMLQTELPLQWTNDRRRLSEAAAVIFHIPDFREMGDARKYPGQLWVGRSMESKENYHRMADPHFMRHFDVTMTYEAGSDVWWPYLPGAVWWEKTRARAIPPKTQTAPVALFQSSGINRSGREEFATELARHIGIDSYGSFMRNRSIEGPDLGAETKIDTIGRYKFCLGLENSVAPDYVTEKMFQPLSAGTIPVYLGAQNVDEFVPPNSYINAADFSGPADLAAYLHYLAATPQAYEAYFAWRSMPLPESLALRLQGLDKSSEYRLMAHLHERLKGLPKQPSGPSSLPFGYSSFVRARLRRWRKGPR
ncbi:alpha-1,3-fucosyltransferase [Mesorhizobium sp. INR15]|nr:alpha-1,3-fucosyltransferase [Mesorhizobium sp. INR15]